MRKFWANLLSAFVFPRERRHQLRRSLTTKSRDQLLEERMYALASLVKAQSVHPKSFAPYRGINSGREVVIIATGPTLNDYEPIEGAVHIGMNSAFKWKKAKLDYYFFQDASFAGLDRNNPPWGYTVADINNYRPDGCVKFYGIAQSMLLQRSPTIRIPLADLLASGANPYILEDPERNSIAYDLTCEPMGSFASVVFSALQFALFTNPKRIYLVGTDCSDIHFDPADKTSLNFGAASAMRGDWQMFKEHVNTSYPELEVVSINPVGLRGLFNDLDTKAPGTKLA